MTEDNYAIKPDAQAFDEIRIVTVPYFKDSGLSGSEWKTKADIQFYRNGNLITNSEQRGTLVGRNIEDAIFHLGSEYLYTLDNMLGCYKGEEGYCDQEGCKEPPTVYYACKDDTIRKFCELHKNRDNNKLDDCMQNYIKLNTTTFNGKLNNNTKFEDIYPDNNQYTNLQPIQTLTNLDHGTRILLIKNAETNSTYPKIICFITLDINNNKDIHDWYNEHIGWVQQPKWYIAHAVYEGFKKDRRCLLFVNDVCIKESLDIDTDMEIFIKLARNINYTSYLKHIK